MSLLFHTELNSTLMITQGRWFVSLYFRTCEVRGRNARMWRYSGRLARFVKVHFECEVIKACVKALNMATRQLSVLMQRCCWELFACVAGPTFLLPSSVPSLFLIHTSSDILFNFVEYIHVSLAHWCLCKSTLPAKSCQSFINCFKSVQGGC